MPRQRIQDPALSIDFFNSGFFSHRNPLFAPFKSYGVNLVQLHDSVLDGANFEDTDYLQWSRRPGFSIFCPTPLADSEVVNQFYSMRNMNGDVISFFDSTERLATFTSSGITSIISKSTTEQGYVNPVGNMVYFSDSSSADMQKWNSVASLSAINPSPWGFPAPTLTPSIFSRGCWLPFTGFVVNNAILDPNGNVEVVTSVFGGSGVSGANEPLWPTTTSSTINDGSVQWTNMGPLNNWLPASFYPVPAVILDTNGNLQLATATTPAVLAWDSSTTYDIGTTVSFAGEYWTCLVSNTNIPPSGGYTVTTTSGSTSTTQPYWVAALNPSQTGTYSTSPYTPNWNKTVGGATVDGNYTWTNLGPGQLVESFGTSYVYCFRTIYGHLSTASPVSLNTGSIFGPTVATITSFAINGNIVTFQGVNNFIPGNVFSVQGLAVGTYLNNQSFTVLAEGLSPSQFSAVFDFPNIASTIDSGSTLNLVATVTGVGNSSPLCNATSVISATEVLAGVVTIYSVNNFVPGLQVTFTGLTVATFLNNLQFQIINVDPSGQWFQVYFTNSLGVVPPNQPVTTDTGTATFNSVEIYRVSDGGGIYLFTGAVSNPTGSTNIPFDSGITPAGAGSDNGIPGIYIWSNPGHVTSPTLYATVTVPTPIGGGGGARFNAIQACKNIATGLSSSVIQASFGANVTGGNTLLIFVTTYDVNSWIISDSQGNTYTLIAQQAAPNDHGIVTNSVYRCSNAAAGPTTIRLSVGLTSDSNDFFGFHAVECSGLDGTVETVNSVYQASGTTLNSGTVTTSSTASVIFSFVWSDLVSNSGNVAVAPASYNSAGSQVVFDPTDGNSYQQMAVAYQVQSAAGTISPKWATPANSKCIGITVPLDLSLYAPSDGLNAQSFSFSVPPAIVVSGIEIDFEAFFTGTPGFGILDVQLLNSGVPVGSVMQISLTNTNQAYVLGGPGSLWGVSWFPTSFSSPTWGVQFTATQLTGGTDATFSVRNVTARVTGGTSTTGWVFNDFTTDENLNELQIAPQNHLNDPPPGAPGSSVGQSVGTITAFWQGRFWMVAGNYVYFDAGPDCVNGVSRESWPPANRFQFAGPPLALVPTADGVGLLVYLADRVAAILGGPETISFYPTDALSNFGISNPNAIFRDGSAIGQFTTQRQYFELIGSERQEIGERISDYLSANFSAASTYATMHRDGLDVGMFLSNGVDKIIRYGSNIGAWSVASYPLCGAGALRSIETSVGVFTLMLANPTGGVTSSVGPANPLVGASIGSGTAWANPSNITMGSPTEYATVTLTSIAPATPTVITGLNLSGAGNVGDTYTTIITPSTEALLPGDTLILFNVVGVASLTPPTVTGVTDSQGNVWTRLIPAQTAVYSAGSESASCEVWATTLSAGVGVSSSITTVSTASSTWTGGQSHPMVVRGISGVAKYIQNSGATPSQPLTGTLGISATALVVTFEGGPFNNPASPDNPPTGYTLAISNSGSFAGSAAYQLGGAGSYTDQWSLQNEGSGIGWVSSLVAFAPVPGTITTSQMLAASGYTLNIPENAVIQGVEVSVTGQSTNSAIEMTVTPLNAPAGAEVDTFTLTGSNTTQVFGGPSDLWGMPSWLSPLGINSANFGFAITASANGVSGTQSVSEVQVKVFYQAPGNYLFARDMNSWGDSGNFGDNNGTPYSQCFLTIGSITLSQPGGELLPLEHVVGYFDAVGTLENGGPSRPDVWILPNEISAKAGIGFVYLPDILQEPPIGQNQPSKSLLALRWPVNMMNSALASQFIHHLQLKIQFEPENAPNTIKALSFGVNTDT